MPTTLEIDLSHLRQCKKCALPIVWLKSVNGKPYPVNSTGFPIREGRLVVTKNDFHNCDDKKA